MPPGVNIAGLGAGRRNRVRVTTVKVFLQRQVFGAEMKLLERRGVKLELAA
jgi:hypothetical protein